MGTEPAIVLHAQALSDESESSKTKQDNAPAARGRPRSPETRRDILNATKRLLARMPLSRLTIESIADRAKVSKATIYRWWPHKAAIALDVFLSSPDVKKPVEIAPGATSAEALKVRVEGLIRELSGRNGPIVAGLIAESQADSAILDIFYEKFLQARVEPLYDLVEQGRAAGDFPGAPDTDIAVDMILGPLFLRVLSGEGGIDESFRERYPEQVMRVLGGV